MASPIAFGQLLQSLASPGSESISIDQFERALDLGIDTENPDSLDQWARDSLKKHYLAPVVSLQNEGLQYWQRWVIERLHVA